MKYFIGGVIGGLITTVLSIFWVIVGMLIGWRMKTDLNSSNKTKYDVIKVPYNGK